MKRILNLGRILAIFLIVIVVLFVSGLLVGRAPFGKPQYITLPARIPLYGVEEANKATIVFDGDVQARVLDSSSETQLHIQVEANNQTYTGLVETAAIKRVEEAREEQKTTEGPNAWSYLFYFGVVFAIIAVFSGIWVLENSFAAIRPADKRKADVVLFGLGATSATLNITLHWSFWEEVTSGKAFGFFEKLQRLTRSFFVSRPTTVVLNLVEQEARKRAETAKNPGDLAGIDDLSADEKFLAELKKEAAEAGIVVRGLMVETDLSGDAVQFIRGLEEGSELGAVVKAVCNAAGINTSEGQIAVLNAIIERERADSRGSLERAGGELLGRLTSFVDSLVEGGFRSLIPTLFKGGTNVDEV